MLSSWVSRSSASPKPKPAGQLPPPPKARRPRRTGSNYVPPGINALVRSVGGPRRPPPGSFLARVPPGGAHGRPFVVRLPPGHGPGSGTRSGKRVVLVVPVKGGAPRGPAVVPVVRGPGGPHSDLAPPAPGVRDHRPPPRHPSPGVEVIREASGRYRPLAELPPKQQHTVVNTQNVYTLDDPQLRRSAIKGYGPPKPRDVISCTELGGQDCHV